MGHHADPYILHVVLGGCVSRPPVPYGVTEDTGGHIAYAIGAATAFAARHPTGRADIVTRRFAAPGLPADCAAARTPLGPNADILRIDSGEPGYLEKAALAADVPGFVRGLLDHLAAAPRLPDMLHAHFADAAEVAMAVRGRFGIPFAYTPHSLGRDAALAAAPGTASPDRIAAEARALAEADAVIVSSRDEAERQVARYGVPCAPRIHRLMPGIVPLPADASAVRGRAWLAPWLDAPDRPALLAVARTVRTNNLGGLVDLYAARADLHERANLVILAGQHGAAGGTEARAVQAELAAAAEGPLRGRLALPACHGPGDLADAYAYAAASDGLFVTPAWFEPFGLTLLEAAAAGLPTVATCHGGPVDIADLCGHVRLADPTDATAFGDTVAAALTDGDWRREAAVRAAEARRRHSWDAYARAQARIAVELSAPPVPARTPERLLVTDLDATLTGDAEAAARFRAWRTARRSVVWALATGRSLTEARFVLDAWGLPHPDAFATSTGSEVYVRDGATWVADPAWIARVSPGWDAAAVERCLADLPDLVLQPDVEQRTFKRGYLSEAPWAAAVRVRERLADAGLPALVVPSHGCLVDVLPARAGKGAALAHLAGRYGLGLAATVGAGDSGNDVDLLAAAGAAILVANHDADLAPLADLAHAYVAAAPFADGVLEGVEATEPPGTESGDVAAAE